MNTYWWIFLAVVAAALLWKGGDALYQLYGYYRLNAHTEAKIREWSVEKLSEERFVPKAHYQFEVDRMLFSNSYLFRHLHSLNLWAAEQEIKKLSQEKFQAWYSRANPQVSALQKNFPLKECLTAAFLAALLVYFVWLGHYVTRYEPHLPQK